MNMSTVEAVTMPGTEEETRNLVTPAPPDGATTSPVSQRNVSPGLGTDKIPTSAAPTVAPVTHFPEAATTAINDNDNSGIITRPQRSSSDNPLSPHPGESDTTVSFTEEGGRTTDNYSATRTSAASDSSDAFSRSSPTPAYANNTTFTAPTAESDPQSRALSQLFTESTTSISTSFVPTTDKISVSTHPSGAGTSWRNLAHTTTGGQRTEVPASIPPTSYKEVVITQSTVVGGENISSTETMTNDGTGPGVHAGTAGDLTSRDPGLVNETGRSGATEATPPAFSESLDALDSSSVSDDGSGLTGTYVTDPSGLPTDGNSPLSVTISEGRAGDKISPTTSSTAVGTSPLPGVTEINETRTEINEAVTLEEDKMSSAQVDTRVTTPAAYNSSSESVSFKTTDITSHGKQTSFTSSGTTAPSTAEDSAGTGQTDMSTNAATSTAIPPSVSTAETFSIYNNFITTLPVSDGTSERSRVTVSTVQDVRSTSRLHDVTSHIHTTSPTTTQAETTSQATSPAETTTTSPAPVTSARPPAPSTVTTTASWGRETTGPGDPVPATAAPVAGGLAAGAIAGIVIVVILVLVIVVLLVLFLLRRARKRRSSGDEEENPADYDYRINGNDKVSRYDNHNHGNAHGNHNNHVSSPGNDNMAMDVLESPKPLATYFKPQSGTSLDSMGSDVPPTFSVNVTGAPGSPEEGRGDSDPEPDGSQSLQMPASLLNQSRVSIGPIMLSMGDDSDNAPVGAYDNMYSAGTFRD